MVSPETTMQAKTSTKSVVALAEEPARLSFSADFFDDDDDSFISISPGSSADKNSDFVREKPRNGSEFEFLSGKNSVDGGNTPMLSADELFFEGKLLPFWQVTEKKLSEITLKSSSDTTLEMENHNKRPQPKPNCTNTAATEEAAARMRASAGILLGREKPEPRMWFVDDDPSPRPPTCTALWKELLRLKKNKGGSTLSPSSSSSSTSSSSSSLGDAAAMEEKQKSETTTTTTTTTTMSSREKHINRIKKGLERTRSASFRIRPMVNVPICAPSSAKSHSLPPLFPLRKSKIVQR